MCVANEQTHTGEYRPIRDYVGLWAHVGSGIHKKAIRDDAGPWAYFDARWGRMEPTSDRRHGRWRRPTTYTQVAPMMARRPDNMSDTCNRTLLIYFIAASFHIQSFAAPHNCDAAASWWRWQKRRQRMAIQRRQRQAVFVSCLTQHS